MSLIQQLISASDRAGRLECEKAIQRRFMPRRRIRKEPEITAARIEEQIP